MNTQRPYKETLRGRNAPILLPLTAFALSLLFPLKKKFKTTNQVQIYPFGFIYKTFQDFIYPNSFIIFAFQYRLSKLYNDMGLEQRLSALRKEKKISQQELAEQAGIHPNVLGRYERGEATPSVEMAAKLANALGVSLDYLVGNTDVELDKTLLDKVISIQKLPDEDKQAIMYSIDGLIQHAKTRLAYK